MNKKLIGELRLALQESSDRKLREDCAKMTTQLNIVK